MRGEKKRKGIISGSSRRGRGGVGPGGLREESIACLPRMRIEKKGRRRPPEVTVENETICPVETRWEQKEEEELEEEKGGGLDMPVLLLLPSPSFSIVRRRLERERTGQMSSSFLLLLLVGFF